MCDFVKRAQGGHDKAFIVGNEPLMAVLVGRYAERLRSAINVRFGVCRVRRMYIGAALLPIVRRTGLRDAVNISCSVVR